MTTKHEPTTEERIAEIRAHVAQREPGCLYGGDTEDITFLLAEVDRLRAAAPPASVVEAMAKLDGITARGHVHGAVESLNVARSWFGAENDMTLKHIDLTLARLLAARALLTAPGDGR